MTEPLSELEGWACHSTTPTLRADLCELGQKFTLSEPQSFYCWKWQPLPKKVVIDQNVILPTLVTHFIHCDCL